MRRITKAYLDTLGQPEGEAVLHDILNFCGLASTSMSADPHLTAFREGKRAVALYILKRMRMETVEDTKKILDARGPTAPDDEPILTGDEP